MKIVAVRILVLLTVFFTLEWRFHFCLYYSWSRGVWSTNRRVQGGDGDLGEWSDESVTQSVVTNVHQYAVEFAIEYVEEKGAMCCPFDLYKNHRFSLTSSFSILLCKVSGSSPLPCDFAAWDKNGDGHVDLEEFSSVAYPYVKEGDLALAFQSTDKDGMSTYGRYNKLFRRRKFLNA